MDNNLFIVALVVAIMVLVIALSYFLSSRSKIIRELRKSPSKPINTVKQGEYARLHGSVEAAEEPLKAPLSGRPCVFYHITVEQKADKGWRTVIDDLQFQPFYLNSNGEKALIQAIRKNSLLFYLEVDHKRKSGWANKATPKLEAYLRKHNRKSKSWLFNASLTLRYNEAVLAIGEQVVVKGTAEWMRLDEPLEGFNYSRLLKLNATLNKKLLVTDLPKALKTLPKIRG